MKMAKASERDIDAAGNAMSILNDISSGYYPSNEGDADAPTFFDPDNADHLRHFYDLMNATLDTSPGWPGRVIGGMCYVILFDENRIVDPSADTLEIHPRFSKVAAQRDDLLAALKACRLELHYVSQQLCSEGWTEGKTVKDALANGLSAITRAEGGAA